MSHLKCIATYSVGVEHICKSDIKVINARTGSIESVVEEVLFFLLAISRKFMDRVSLLNNGEWNRQIDGCNSLRGKTIGIVGYGNIGKAVGRVCEQLGMNVMCNNLKLYTPLDELLAKSDVVTLHIDGRESNYKFFDERCFKLMKENSILINTSRGKVMDEDMLLRHASKFKGIGLDVFFSEPKESVCNYSSEVMKLKNVIATPHIGGRSKEAQENIAVEVSTKAVEYLKSL